jgi:hypothetical protein
MKNRLSFFINKPYNGLQLQDCDAEYSITITLRKLRQVIQVEISLQFKKIGCALDLETGDRGWVDLRNAVALAWNFRYD